MNIEATSAEFRTADTGVATTFGEESGVYYVMRDGGRAPRFEHRTRHAATKEAIRLAGKHPGSNFHVVKLKNTFRKAAEVKPTPDERKKTETERQFVAREKLFLGQAVKIADTHFEHSGQTGEIVSFPEGDPTVFVRIGDSLMPRRFSPTSLIPVEVESKAEDAPAPVVIQVGDIVIDQAGIEAEVLEITADEGRAFIVYDGRFSRWIEISELRLHPAGSRADAYARDTGRTLGEILEAAIKQAAEPTPTPNSARFERGTEVYVLIGSTTIYGSFAMEATVYAYAANGADMWVVVEGPHGLPVKRIVKIEQVIARTDKRVKVIEL